MMRGRDVFATAVRRRDGAIVLDKRPVPHYLEGWRIARLPLIRGTFALIEALTLGLRSLQFSGNVAMQDELDAEAAKPPDERDDPKPAGRPWLAALVAAALGAAAVLLVAPRLAPRLTGLMPAGTSDHAALQATRVLVAALFVVIVAGLLLRKPKPSSGPQTLDDSAMWLAMLPALAFGLALFVLLPSWLAGFLRVEGGYATAALKNLLEGLIRLAVILGYIGAISYIGQVRRVFQYHGAEHKVINAFEAEGRVDEETALRHSPLHPRCGTAFLLLFIVLKVIVGCFFGWPVWYVRFALRLAMVPVVAALAYEATRLAGRFRHSPIMQVLSAPGLLLQRLTTREPESPMIQVALYALAAVAPEVVLPAGWPPAHEFGPAAAAAVQEEEVEA